MHASIVVIEAFQFIICRYVDFFTATLHRPLYQRHAIGDNRLAKYDSTFYRRKLHLMITNIKASILRYREEIKADSASWHGRDYDAWPVQAKRAFIIISVIDYLSFRLSFAMMAALLI